MNKSDILAVLRDNPRPMTKRDLARAFGLKGSAPRQALKKIIKTLEDDGSIVKQAGGTYRLPEGMPHTLVVEITDIDVDGDPLCRPVDPMDIDVRILLMPDKKASAAPRVGNRALVRLEKSDTDEDTYEAHTIRRLDDDKGRIIGMFDHTGSGRPVVRPTDKKAKHDYLVDEGDINGAKPGDLVLVEIQPSRTLHKKKVRVVQVLGDRDDVKAISLISLHEAGLREDFPQKVIDETKGMKVPDLKGREDLRDVPLVTIDGADARDFDDAVYAQPLDDGGHHIIVAIADVSYYVRHGTALDDEAQRRGNSTYFPDRVVPMLPEALSNDLCSLRPKENRAAMAAHLWIDKSGKLTKYKFTRALIRSAARLIYEQVQAAVDGQPDDTTGPLLDRIIKPLYGAYAVLDKARQKRGALDLDLPEKQILIDDSGNMTGVKKRERLDAHKMIEEFMVLANVAAATAIEAKARPESNRKGRYPCVYRVHDKPSMAKMDSAKEFVESFGLSLPKGQVVEPGKLNKLLQDAGKLPYSHLISMMVLRCQSQALYATHNVGHFGLALSRYAHFTSPIRRYADLMVHRALVGAYGLGPGGLHESEVQRIDTICEEISQCERRSMVAERNAIDRFTGSYLASHIGAEFEGRISGVTRFGLFIELNESGADGLVPIRALPQDYYIHDEDAHALIGRRHKRIYRLGAPVTVVIEEADGLTGSSIFALTSAYEKGADIPGFELKSERRKEQRGYGGKPRSDKGGNTGRKIRKKKGKQTTPKHKRKKR